MANTFQISAGDWGPSGRHFFIRYMILGVGCSGYRESLLQFLWRFYELWCGILWESFRCWVKAKKKGEMWEFVTICFKISFWDSVQFRISVKIIKDRAGSMKFEQYSSEKNQQDLVNRGESSQRTLTSMW